MSRIPREIKSETHALRLWLVAVLCVVFFGIAEAKALSTSNVDQTQVGKIRENRSSLPLAKKPDLPPELKANMPIEAMIDPDELANQETFHVSAKCDATPVNDPSAPLAEDTHQELLQIQNDPFFN
jgi:hypothetical protein